MSKKNFLVIAAICAVFNIAAAQSVSAYSIDLSIEKKEICIDDIPADGKVSLAISIYNNPVTDQLGMTITKDSALSFVGFTPLNNVDPVFFNSYSSGMRPDNKDTANFNFWCSPDYYNGNNTLAYINLRLPEDVSAGSFYPVNFTNNEDLYIYYINESGNRDYLLANSFNLTNGGIQINSAPQPPAEPIPAGPVPTAPVPAQEPQTPAAPPRDPNPVQQQPDNTQAPTNAPVAAKTSSEATSVSLNTSASSVSSSPSENNTSQKFSTVSSSKKSSDTTRLSDTEADFETTFVSKNKDDNKKSKSSPAPFIAVAVVLAAATAVIILKIKGRKS